MTYLELEVRENFCNFMKRSYAYIEQRWEPKFEKEVTFIGKTVMLGNEGSNSRK